VLKSHLYRGRWQEWKIHCVLFVYLAFSGICQWCL